MTSTTNELLLKTRKGATASFETKQWTEVLVALGFQVCVAKTRNTITKVDITSAGGELFTVVKEPNYRRITFYKLGSWLKSIGFDLVAETSKLLGMDTPENEKKLHDLYVRDLTNTGTCPVCEGNYKRESDGSIGHHGFRRPGDGMLHGSCFAVGFQPWELSSEGAVAYLAQAVRPHLVIAEEHLANLNAGKVTKFFRDVGYGQNKKTVEVTRESDEYQFEQLLRSAIYNAENDVKWTKTEIARLENRIAGWKLDILPEVKYAGKFKAA